MKFFLFSVKSEVKPEVKLEDRVSSMDIKNETDTKPHSNLVYPNSLDEFFERTSPQLFLLQVSRFVCLPMFFCFQMNLMIISIADAGCTTGSWYRTRASR